MKHQFQLSLFFLLRRTEGWMEEWELKDGALTRGSFRLGWEGRRPWRRNILQLSSAPATSNARNHGRTKMRRDDSPLGKPKAFGAQRRARSNRGNKQHKTTTGSHCKMIFYKTTFTSTPLDQCSLHLQTCAKMRRSSLTAWGKPDGSTWLAGETLSIRCVSRGFIASETPFSVS